MEFLGEGSYGAVISAYDNKLKKEVAVKKLNKIEDVVWLLFYFNKPIKIDAKKVLREIRMMKNFR